MECPYCKHTFFARWGEYFREALGKRTCPKCGKTARLKYSVYYFMRCMLMNIVVALVPASLIAWFVLHNLLYVFPLFLLLVVVIALPLDRYMDNHFRLLKIIPEKDPGK